MFNYGILAMRIACHLVVLTALCLIAARADATLTLASDHPTGSPLTVSPGGTSGNLTARVFDSTSGSAAADNLTGYSLTLQIVPQGGATGTLAFASPATSAAAAEPANYVFAAAANAGLNVINSGSGLYFFDFNSPFSGGVDVPAAPGFNLLAMTFTASANASGSFHVVVLPGAANSEWTDNNQPTQLGHAFLNVPIGGGPVAIAEVLITTALAGDYNGNGTVDAADYVLWRNAGPLANEGVTPGSNTPEDYDFWRSRFGTTAGSGIGAVAAVPKPGTAVLLLAGVAALFPRRRAIAS
jgi:hypothetical protein